MTVLSGALNLPAVSLPLPASLLWVPYKNRHATQATYSLFLVKNAFTIPLDNSNADPGNAFVVFENGEKNQLSEISGYARTRPNYG